MCIRDSYSLEGYKLEYEKIAKEFSAKVNKKARIVVRLHPNVWNQSNFINYGENILNGTVYPDMQELLLACDALISDYSSCVFDFAILKKPVFICALDLSLIHISGIADHLWWLVVGCNGVMHWRCTGIFF